MTLACKSRPASVGTCRQRQSWTAEVEQHMGYATCAITARVSTVEVRLPTIACVVTAVADDHQKTSYVVQVIARVALLALHGLLCASTKVCLLLQAEKGLHQPCRMPKLKSLDNASAPLRLKLLATFAAVSPRSFIWSASDSCVDDLRRKCDGLRPSCQSCIKRGEPCVYSGPASVPPSTTAGSSRQKTATTSPDDDDSDAIMNSRDGSPDIPLADHSPAKDPSRPRYPLGNGLGHAGSTRNPDGTNCTRPVACFFCIRAYLSISTVRPSYLRCASYRCGDPMYRGFSNLRQLYPS